MRGRVDVRRRGRRGGLWGGRSRADAANTLVIESILVGVLLFGALYFVVTLDQPTVDTVRARRSVQVAGDDALIVLAGVAACDGLAGEALTDCENSYGGSLLKRALTEALVGEPKNLTTKLRALLPAGVMWNVYLENGAGAISVHDSGEATGERVSASLAFTPEWNSTALATHLSRYNWTAVGENDLVVHALPLWKSRAVAPTGEFRVRFSNAHSVDVANVTVDGERGRLSTLAYWRMNEGAGATAADDLGAHDLAGIADAARWVDGRVGTALHFDEAADALAVGPSADLRASRVSLLAWIRPDALPSTGDVRLALFDTGDGESLELRLTDATGLPRALVTDGATTVEAVGATALKPGTWTHLAATYENGRLRLYVNGTLEGSASSGPDFSTAASPTVTLGGKKDAADADTVIFVGRLDEVRVYERALAADEFSLLRWADVPPSRAAAAGWDARTSGNRSIASLGTWSAVPLNGSTLYVVGTDAALSDAAATLKSGLEDSVLAAYGNGTWTRTVEAGGEVAIEFDFQPLLDRLEAAGVRFAAGSENVTTVTLRAPLSQPPGENVKAYEAFNRTIAGPTGYANFTLPRGAILGANLVVASLNLTLDGATPQGVLARKVDYVNVALPGTTAPPINPVYRVGLELWLPEWH